MAVKEVQRLNTQPVSQSPETKKLKTWGKRMSKAARKSAGAVSSLVKHVTVPKTSTIATVSGTAGTAAGALLKNLAPKIMYELTERGVISAGSRFGIPKSVGRWLAAAGMGVGGIPKMPKWAILAFGLGVSTLTTTALNSAYLAYQSGSKQESQ